ncbi:TPA: hypothetical protein ACPJZ8_002533 [Vibrio diabolicus]|uniref:Uncharacterized protein n=1 Tax=Vibrio antiquarius (strain Ex25) TaxID=150340 RepID=A0ACA6QNL8_VIBAE|nr:MULTISPECIES: hypothetical protein [Vibrio]PLX58202.1 MAG: hypothetical protein C0632_19560 [Vibrio alginolyticus]ACY52034.1 hypothetical protein VEA_003874 [Vibrio antiquarius]AVF59671.1 hypothetical protein AL537_10165 [Vibrio diabolicus]MCF7371460.1 hypothetical protein [Vibrio sp. J2-3(2022)]MCF7452616.1 hypothetical protein [Vibrio sp. A1-1]
MVMKRLAVTLGLSVAMMSTFAVANTSPRKVFECSVNQTMNFSIFIEQGKGGIIFNESIENQSSVLQRIKPQDYRVEHYHRALVDEKSLEFSIGERVILVSEYFSEEFNEAEKILSVTLREPEQTQYFECEEGSMSNLALLFHESAE